MRLGFLVKCRGRIIGVFEINVVHIAPLPTSFASGPSVSHILDSGQSQLGGLEVGVGHISKSKLKIPWF